jgi:hypothetical protein
MLHVPTHCSLEGVLSIIVMDEVWEYVSNQIALHATMVSPQTFTSNLIRKGRERYPRWDGRSAML